MHAAFLASATRFDEVKIFRREIGGVGDFAGLNGDGVNAAGVGAVEVCGDDGG